MSPPQLTGGGGNTILYNPVIMLPNQNGGINESSPTNEIVIDTEQDNDGIENIESLINNQKPKPKRTDGIELLINDISEIEGNKEDGNKEEGEEKKTIKFN